MVAFREPRDAVLCCLEIQQNLHHADWPAQLRTVDASPFCELTKDRWPKHKDSSTTPGRS